MRCLPLGEIAETGDPRASSSSCLARLALHRRPVIVCDGGVESMWREQDWPWPCWDISLPRFLFKLFGPMKSQRTMSRHTATPLFRIDLNPIESAR